MPKSEPSLQWQIESFISYLKECTEQIGMQGGVSHVPDTAVANDLFHDILNSRDQLPEVLHEKLVKYCHFVEMTLRSREWQRTCDWANLRFKDFDAAAYQLAVDNKTPQNIFRIEGGLVVIAFRGRTTQLPVDRNLARLQKLLVQYANTSFASPMELDAALDGVIVPSSSNHGLSTENAPGEGFSTSGRNPTEPTQCRHFLEKELKEIDEKIGRAEISLDCETYDKLEKQRQIISKRIRELHYSRKTAWDSSAKKVHQKFSKSLRRAINNIGDQELGSHLRQTLLPITYPFSYDPTPPIDWTE